MKIVIDAMGGDHAPKSNVEGACEAAKMWKDMEIILVGDEAQIRPLLQDAPSNITVVHAPERIEADDEPVKAVRRKKGASMVMAGRMVREGEADCMISAGNTGALMTTGLLVVGRMDGVERPALAPMLPTTDGKGVLALDLGANMDAKPEHLVQYAIMGSIYREKMHGMPKPRVGLLNVGTEAKKGNELTKEVFPMLEKANIHFVGNVEARDVLESNCDILVCDGFVGNVMLKSLEGTAGSLFDVLKKEFTRNFMTKMAAAILMPGLKRLKKMMDYKEHGGAPLLGLQGLVIKAHGSSDKRAVLNAIRQARTALENQLIATISSEIAGNNSGK
ncbi:phosphate acyltransferase PlsX [Paenibacillus aquistagni]|uniref:Phosphate acyltransferase n=1 Tax=Paenibacillus aquistagni TaxID=1852522 RepID=A0A1X7IL07_9BACL|nr:phosphate acyltransferase PlsX [Paenibacillus aquistagni]NMM51292.1 phosphate acyltransferase PlsX [Paenibacillus aquistagni]SMG15657.1 phosphate:acyl-[acyl carrier protein] acyltransferase [Paenibacillus aquistagni]